MQTNQEDGTTVEPAELIDSLRKASWTAYDGKVATRGEASETLGRWRALGLKIGFAHGHFDLSQAAALLRLRQARSGCDRLVVGVVADAGPARDGQLPSDSGGALVSLLAALEFVDLVVPVSETPEFLGSEFGAQVVIDVDS